MIALIVTWAITYLCVWKGVKSSSYVVWFTVPGPIIFIFIMVMNGLCLPNADEGIRMYLKGEIDGVPADASKKLSDGQMWADAVGQIFFSLGVCMGVMTSYASYNRRNKPIIRDVFVISFGNCMLSFFSGFAVFSIVGYLKWIGSPVAKNNSSTGLAFTAYPAAAETLPASNFWTFILGLTLFTLGIDTAFSLVEAVSTVIYDTEGGKLVPRKLTALIICVLGWLGSLLFCSSWGFTYFDVIDRYISVYLMFILGIGQCAAAAWFFQAGHVFTDARKNSAMVITVVYWLGTLVMGPVTIFVLKGGEGKTAYSLQAYGILIFWVLMIIAWIISFAIKPKDFNAERWCKEIFFYGAYELAIKVASRHNENTAGAHQWWYNIFIGWWAFSIKYFIPWCLWTLMMWNFAADIATDDAGNIIGYGGYHVFW
jgi:SNF family Na+-dependent transporter